jgi:hypothetical protein
MLIDCILEAVGNVPLIRLTRISLAACSPAEFLNLRKH